MGSSVPVFDQTCGWQMMTRSGAIGRRIEQQRNDGDEAGQDWDVYPSLT